MGDATTEPTPLRTGEKGHCLRCSLSPCVFFARSYTNYRSHLQRIHYCPDCAQYCNIKSQHICPCPGARMGHVDSQMQPDMTNFSEVSRAHYGTMILYRYKHEITAPDIESTFTELKTSVKNFLQDLYNIHQLIKLEIGLGIKMQKEVKDDEGNVKMHEAIIYFKSKHYELEWADGIDFILLSSASDIINKNNTFMENGSGWAVKEMSIFEIKMAEIALFGRSVGSGYLPMPFPCRKGIVNFRNKNNRCFLYCVSASLYWDELSNRNKLLGRNNRNLTRHRMWEKYIKRLNTHGVCGPVDVYKDIPLFEENNNVAVNVLTHKDGKVIPMRRSKYESDKVVNLFLIRSNVQGKDCQHFVLIHDLNIFLCNGSKTKVYMCQKCFRDFKTQENLSNHICGESHVREELPKKGEALEFTRHEMTLQYPFVLYWDFEAFSKPLGERRGPSTTLNSEFLPASYSLCLVHSTIIGPKIIAFEYYDGPKCVEHFLQRVFHHAKNVLYHIRATNNSATPTSAELDRHNKATHCEFCSRKFTSGQDEPKVIKQFHHSHQTGKFLHSLCQKCNLKVKYKNDLVCVSHNGGGYDFHLILQHLESDLFDPSDVNVISKGGEKILQIEIAAKNEYIPELRSVHNAPFVPSNKKTCGLRKLRVRFIDSFQFLSSSLSNLAAGLKNEKAVSLNLVKQGLPFISSSSQRDESLLWEKLPYPYSYLTSPQVLESDHPIPGREHFYNDLKKEDITDKEWELILKLRHHFDLKDFRQFTRLYTMVDVILLSVVWENFRQNCIKSYSLDPCYVCTASSYSWNCMLKFTKAKIEYISDRKMLDMVKSGVRGGTSFCTRKIVTANNERSPLGYDATQERTHLVYNDKVSLYATAMLDKMPHSNYNWTDREKLKAIDWKSFAGENDTGYILNVSLKYPESIHDESSDLPFAPEKRRIKITDLSPQQQTTMKNLGLVRSCTTEPRLLLHCEDRINYTLHWRALKYYLQAGLQLIDIHSGFSFTEVAYFQPYIQFNIDQRKLARTESQRALFKILNNSCFGKCLQSNKGNLQVKFCGSAAESQKWTTNPRCVDFTPVSKNISMVMLSPKVIKLNKPIQSGMVILDLAKVIFYYGYYQQLKVVFPGGISLVYHDTDSAIILVKDPGNTFLKDLERHKEFFDFSKIPVDHEIFKLHENLLETRKENAGVSGLWKLEGICLQQISANKSKQYSILYFNQAEELKCKGVTYAALKEFTHEKYKSVIQEQKVVHLQCNYIRSMNHRLFNVTVNKIGFHSLDIFRVYPDENDYNFSLPFGHYKLKMYV